MDPQDGLIIIANIEKILGLVFIFVMYDNIFES